MSFLIPAAYAQEAAAGPAGTGFEWVFLVGFLVIFYLMIWRPQAKRARNTRTGRRPAEGRRSGHLRRHRRQGHQGR